MTLDQATDKIYSALEKLGPQAVEVALTVGRGAALRQLVYGALTIGVAYGLVLTATALWKKSKAVEDEFDRIFPIIASAVVALSAGVAGTVGIFQILDPLAWIGLVNPAAFLAQRFLP